MANGSTTAGWTSRCGPCSRTSGARGGDDLTWTVRPYILVPDGAAAALRAAGALLTVWATASGQSLVYGEQVAAIRNAFDSAARAPQLRCEIKAIRPALDFSLRFETGYAVDVPMIQFTGQGHSLRVGQTGPAPSRRGVPDAGSQRHGGGRSLDARAEFSDASGVDRRFRPEAMEIKGSRVPLTAVPDWQRVLAERRSKGFKRMEIVLPLQGEDNSGVFRFPGEHVQIPKGFQSEWRTVTLSDAGRISR
jgi:hypothetical protein